MPATPTLAEVIWAAIKADRDDLMTTTVGVVQKYDPTTDTIDVVCPILRGLNVQGDIEYEELPVLPNVPIGWPEAGGFIIHFPIKAGDRVTLQFTHDSLGVWRETGDQAIPGDIRRHSLASCIAHPGIRHSKAPLSPDPTHIAARTAGLVIGKEGGDAVIEITEEGIGLGHLAIEPVALAPPTATAIAALGVWAAVLQANMLTIPLVPALAAAMVTPTATLAAAMGLNAPLIPATLVKGK